LIAKGQNLKNRFSGSRIEKTAFPARLFSPRNKVPGHRHNRCVGHPDIARPEAAVIIPTVVAVAPNGPLIGMGLTLVAAARALPSADRSGVRVPIEATRRDAERREARGLRFRLCGLQSGVKFRLLII
jgi:hypothetical protein